MLHIHGSNRRSAQCKPPWTHIHGLNRIPRQTSIHALMIHTSIPATLSMGEGKQRLWSFLTFIVRRRGTKDDGRGTRALSKGERFQAAQLIKVICKVCELSFKEDLRGTASCVSLVFWRMSSTPRVVNTPSPLNDSKRAL